MPLTKQAIKKMHHDHMRHGQNEKVLLGIKSLVKSMHKHPSQKTLTKVFSALDKASKRNTVHPNRAARLKSRLSQLLKTK